MFRILVEAMVGVWLLVVIQPRNRPALWTPISLALFLYLISLALSTVLGVDPYNSFWDTQERMLGVFTLLHYFVFYCVATTVIKDWKTWRVLLLVLLSVSIVVALIAIAQKIDPELLVNRGVDRVSSTLGHPSYLAGLGLFSFFCSLLILLKDRGRWLSIFAIIAAILSLVAILISETRGTIIGFIAALFVLGIGYFFTLDRGGGARRILCIVAVMLVALCVTVFVFRDTPALQKIPGIRRLAQVSTTATTARTRILHWNIAIQATRERPLLGWGPNNFYYAFNRYYNPELFEFGIAETWVDNAHNIVFNTLAEQGFVGLVCYCAIFVVSIFLVWQRLRQKIVDSQVACISTAFLIGHFVHNLFVFENPTSFLYLMVFLAFLNTQLYRQESDHTERLAAKGFLLAGGIGLVLAGFIWKTNVNIARANMLLLKAIGFIHLRAPAPAWSAYEKAEETSSIHINHARGVLASVLVEQLPFYIQEGKKDKVQPFLVKMFQELKKNKERHPLDIRNNIHRGNLADLISTYFQDKSYCKQIENELEAALQMSPNRQEILFLLSNIKMRLNKPRESIEFLEQAIKANPKIGESWWRLALVYKIMGKDEKAKEVIHEAKEKGALFKSVDKQKVQFILSNLPK